MSESNPVAVAEPIAIGRYLLHRQIARGGMASIHLARLMGDEGFSRIVAAKRLHPQYAEDRELVAMFLDEARIASKVHHRNVVPVLDVVAMNDELVLVQEHVHGAPLSWLLKAAFQAKSHLPIPVAVSIASQVLSGLHAAHDTVDEMGTPLNIVHRDVSPQNVIVATDGTARLVDFGVAKATIEAYVTRKGSFKGKLAYAAPEQLRGRATKQSDIYAASVVLWEMLVGARLRRSNDRVQLISDILSGAPPMVTQVLASERAYCGAYRWNQLEALDPIIQQGLAVDVRARWTTAAAMEEALVAAVEPAPTSDVAEWLHALGQDFIDQRDRVIAAEEATWRKSSQSVARRAPSPVPRDEPRSRSRIVLPLVALAGALIVAMVLVLARGSSGEPATAVPAATPAPTQPIVAPQQPTESFASPPTTDPLAAAPTPTVASPNAPAHSEPQADPAPSAARPPTLTPPRSHPVRPPPRPVAKPHTIPRPAATARPAATGCTPPYYFEGAKKIFKPSCL